MVFCIVSQCDWKLMDFLASLLVIGRYLFKSIATGSIYLSILISTGSSVGVNDEINMKADSCQV